MVDDLKGFNESAHVGSIARPVITFLCLLRAFSPFNDHPSLTAAYFSSRLALKLHLAVKENRHSLDEHNGLRIPK